MSTFFSIVIPTFNRRNFILKTIDTLLAQDYPHFEIIVVDDGSTDGTDEAIKQLNNPKVTFHLIPNGERGAARNYGAIKAKGQYVNFFDSDDLAYPHHLSTALKFIDEHNAPEVFHLYFDVKTPAGEKVPQVNLGTKPINQWLIDLGNVCSCNGMFLRKDIALQFPFSQVRILSGTEDYALWLRLSSRYTIHHSPVVTSTIINHDTRSVVSHDFTKLINRNMFLLEYLQTDAHFMKYIGRRFNIIQAECYSYIALHIILAGKNREAFKWLIKAIKTDFTFPVRHIRFIAIIKHAVKNILG